uniref:Tick salivary protein-SALP15 n=1 Tax=Rhipicephalus appendiculatus TaxID=34631 RepID=A0A131YT69_RHIAP
MTGWISLAFLVAIAYVSGNDLPLGCTRVTSSSFGNTSRPRFGLFCEKVNEKEHPNRIWIGLNLNMQNCSVCCAGKNTTGPNIHYQVSALSAASCKNRNTKGKATRKSARSNNK